MTADQLKPDKIVRGPVFPEAVQVIVTIPMGDAVKLIAKPPPSPGISKSASTSLFTARTSAWLNCMSTRDTNAAGPSTNGSNTAHRWLNRNQ